MIAGKVPDISSRRGHLELDTADLIKAEHMSLWRTLEPKQGMIAWQLPHTLQWSL